VALRVRLLWATARGQGDLPGRALRVPQQDDHDRPAPAHQHPHLQYPPVQAQCGDEEGGMKLDRRWIEAAARPGAVRVPEVHLECSADN